MVTMLLYYLYISFIQQKWLQFMKIQLPAAGSYSCSCNICASIGYHEISVASLVVWVHCMVIIVCISDICFAYAPD